MDRLSQTGLYFEFLRIYDPKILITIVNVIWQWALIAYFVSAAALSTIRMSNVRNFLWEKHTSFSVVLMIMIYGVPLTLMFPTFFIQTLFVYQPGETCPVIFTNVPTPSTGVMSFGNRAAIGIFSILLVWATICNITTFYTLCRTPGWAKSASTRRVEFALTLIIVATFTTIATNVAFQVVVMLVGPTRFIYIVSRSIWDIASFSNVWILAITHPSFRVRLAKQRVSEVTTSTA